MAGSEGGLWEGAAGAASFNLSPAASLEAGVKGALINRPVGAALGVGATSAVGRDRGAAGSRLGARVLAGRSGGGREAAAGGIRV